MGTTGRVPNQAPSFQTSGTRLVNMIAAESHHDNDSHHALWPLAFHIVPGATGTLDSIWHLSIRHLAPRTPCHCSISLHRHGPDEVRHLNGHCPILTDTRPRHCIGH
ncbi:hypothetical protein BVI434_3880004 [Burkholderia vietnamiensis]|nr:hypothetical protein BVI434_3880004 [Burkholderia vietnamiensis]